MRKLVLIAAITFACSIFAQTKEVVPKIHHSKTKVIIGCMISDSCDISPRQGVYLGMVVITTVASKTRNTEELVMLTQKKGIVVASHLGSEQKTVVLFDGDFDGRVDEVRVVDDVTGKITSIRSTKIMEEREVVFFQKYFDGVTDKLLMKILGPSGKSV